MLFAYARALILQKIRLTRVAPSLLDCLYEQLEFYDIPYLQGKNNLLIPQGRNFILDHSFTYLFPLPRTYGIQQAQHLNMIFIALQDPLFPPLSQLIRN